MRYTYALRRSYVWKWLARSSDPIASDDLRAEAARFHAEAAEIETGVPDVSGQSYFESELIEAVDVCFGS